MKRANLLLVLLLVGLVGCTYNSLPDDMATPVAVSEQGFDLTFSTRAEAFDGVELDSEYFVAEQDLESYLNYKQKHSGKKINIKNYSAYGFDNSHTLFYVINYDKGWEVVSADKRTQPTLAYGDDERTFSMGADNTNEAEKLWMDMLASDVLQKRQRGKGARTSDTEEIANDEERARVDYWNRICSDKTRAIEISSASELPWSHNRYILGTTTDTVNIDKGPYIQTRWDQGYPWNEFCPLIAAGYGRSFAGCTIVAGGQLLYYLHQTTGNVMMAPANVNIVGTIDNYQYTFYNYTNAAWSAMALTANEYELGMSDGPTQLVATLLSWIGSNCNITYGDYNSGTRAHPYFLFNWMEREFGITKKVDLSYNASLIVNELDVKRRPILLEGWYDDNGHVWLADGSRTIAGVETVYYLVTEDSLTSDELAHYSIEDATHFINYKLELDYFVHMNWGWGGSHDGYYTLMKSGWDPLGVPFDDVVNIYYNIGFGE